jgi:NAD-dependent SIR2 family protein deacetylase
MMPRAVDGERCALRTCALGGCVRVDDPAARVTTPVKLVRRLSRAAAAACCVDWVATAQRTHFHLSCWQLVEHAAVAPRFRAAFAPRVRGARGAAAAAQPAAVALVLGDAERSLVAEVADTCERFDTAAQARAQAQALARLLRASRHTVAFTGAGISVAAGIPDYRGTAGVDTLAEHGAVEVDAEVFEPRADAETTNEEDAEAVVASASYLRLRPTSCHRALAALRSAGRLSYVITQNCDDLHARAGIPAAQLAELHGNVFIEYCETCLTEYRRPYCVDLFSTDCTAEPWFVRCDACTHGHYTGRLCAARGCGGKLRDTIVNFGDDLHQTVLGGLPAAERECARADLILALGCSMSVTPACDLPRLRMPSATLALVNLQATKADADAQLRVFYPCDDFFEMVMSLLDNDSSA